MNSFSLLPFWGGPCFASPFPMPAGLRGSAAGRAVWGTPRWLRLCFAALAGG